MKFIPKYLSFGFLLFFFCFCSCRDVKQMCHDEILKNFNTSIGNKDTALAVYFWRDASSYDFDRSVEEYTRMEVELEKIEFLIFKLYGTCINYDKRMGQIESLRVEFRNFTLKSIIQEMEKNGGIFNDDGKEGDYFYQTRSMDTIYDFLLKGN